MIPVESIVGEWNSKGIQITCLILKYPPRYTQPGDVKGVSGGPETFQSRVLEPEPSETLLYYTALMAIVHQETC
jgi:hypothetical protein